MLRLFREMDMRRRNFLFSIALSACAGLFRVFELRTMTIFLSGISRGNFDSIFPHKLERLFPSIVQLAHSSYAAGFLAASILFCLFAITASSLSYASEVYTRHQMQLINSRLRQSLFSRFLQFNKAFFDERGYPALQSILLSRSKRVASLLESFQKFFVHIFMLLAYFAILFSISWELTTITFLLLLFFGIVSIALERNASTWEENQIRSQWSLDKKLFQILSCIPLVQASTQEHAERAAFKRISGEELNINYGILKKNQQVRELQNIGSLLVLLVVSMAIALLGVNDNTNFAAHAIAFLIIVRMMTPSVRAVIDFAVATVQSQLSLRIVFDILGERNNRFAAIDGKKELTKFEKEIEIKNISFSYKKGFPILSNLSLRIPRGAMTAIVGSSGSGKTTLAHLLLRLYDIGKGEILIDGINIKEYTFESLRRIIGIVEQDTYLFNESLRHNITYGVGDIDDKTIHETMKNVQLSSLISRMPEGLETMIGERGGNMSCGEKLRTCIARGLMRLPDVLVLDEPSSALDANTEYLMQQYINRLTGDKTLIIISHRLSTIKHASHIVVLEEGTVSEEGTYNELIAQNGIFRNLYEKQRLD